LYSAFEKQPQEKKELIINVAIEEFVKNGYDKASTDIITSRAGISKGILFHYFKSKKNLYLYVVTYALKLIIEKTMEALKGVSSPDFFARVKEIYLLKHKITGPYIKETQLISDAILSPPAAVQKEMEEVANTYYSKYQEDFMLEHIYLRELIQTDRLREGITADKVIKMTMFTCEQLGNKYQTLYKNKQYDFFSEPDPLVQELEDYLQIIEYGVYR